MVRYIYPSRIIGIIVLLITTTWACKVYHFRITQHSRHKTSKIVCAWLRASIVLQSITHPYQWMRHKWHRSIHYRVSIKVLIRIYLSKAYSFWDLKMVILLRINIFKWVCTFFLICQLLFLFLWYLLRVSAQSRDYSLMTAVLDSTLTSLHYHRTQLLHKLPSLFHHLSCLHLVHSFRWPISILLMENLVD